MVSSIDRRAGFRRGRERSARMPARVVRNQAAGGDGARFAVAAGGETDQDAGPGLDLGVRSRTLIAD
jgi:hypothetical protein